MSPDEILALRRNKAFKPVRLVTRKGESFEIRHRELMLVVADFVLIGLQDKPDPEPVGDRSVRVRYEDIVAIEPLETTTVAS